MATTPGIHDHSEGQYSRLLAMESECLQATSYLQAGPWPARPTVMLSAISAGYWACEARVSRVEGNGRLETGSLDTGNVVMGLRVQSRVTPPVSWALPVIATRVYGKPRELNSIQPTEQPHHYPARPMARWLLTCRAAEMVGHINKHQPSESQSPGLWSSLSSLCWLTSTGCPKLC